VKAASLNRLYIYMLLGVGSCSFLPSFAQSRDSLNSNIPQDIRANESSHSPHKATLWSLMLPGAGQVYNKKYWKVPVIYGLLGGSGYLFYDYQQKVRIQNDYFRNLYAQGKQPTVYETEQRDNDRVNRDIMGLAFVVIYALQVVDATVDAHFFEFDIDQKLGVSLLQNPGQLVSIQYRISSN